ncbi:DNA repair protein REV1 [Manduca sexta]|uniref:DNA repair protein REV1 n=1 Tax=Manduca sexta TaxID=7130 RepID=A0A922CDQ1_MANSE|nr:DNA repair protein REV1 [Manduca sexta]KAG6442431.1 hypothetical protein O3G_MSEX002346 [Manduca sexta]
MRRRDDKFPDNGFEAWGGYMQAKIAKLEEQFTKSAGKAESLSHIFNGVSIYVNGYTVPSADELKVLMSNHGGIYHTYQRSEDFVIASNLPDTKVKNMNLSKIVKPEWITDSIMANKLLDYREYLLYKNSRTQQQLNFKTKVDIKKNGDVNNSISNAIFEDMKQNLSTEKSPIATTSSNDHNSHMNIKNDSNEPLKANQKPAVKTAVDPNFISEFYNNSRLHHISQLGASFKQHINDLRENSNFKFPARLELKDRIQALNSNFSQLTFEKGKVIMHIDMDCFFVSVGLRNRPELRGKPVAVTHSKGGQPRSKRPGVDRSTEFNLYKQKQAKKLSKATGTHEDEIEFESRVDNIADEDDKYGSMSEIASCSYEARAKGIGNGMFMGAALKLCPELQTIPYDFEGYKEVAYTLYNTIAQYTLDIEAVSCDEMYVDCTELLKDMDVSAQNFAMVLREEIKSKTGCPCSTGFGGNRLQARLATKRAKPDGQFFLTEDLVEDFMFGIELRDLPGVGRQTAQKLESLGHKSCGSLQSLTLNTLKTHLGNKTGAQLFDQCRGRDLNTLHFYTVRKSVSAEVNYGIRFENNEQCYEFLKQLSAEVHSRLQQFKVLGKCITLKLMVRAEEAPVETAKFMGHGFCNVINKSISLNTATNDIEVITREVISICQKQNIDPKEMRGIGIQVTKLEPLNSKTTKGAISKFLSNKLTKTDIKNENYETSNSKNTILKQPRTGTSEYKQTTPKKEKISLSSPKKSPILGVTTKSPLSKRRGRPPKGSKLRSTSKNLINKFLTGHNSVRDMPYKDPMVKNEIPVKKPIEEINVKQETKIKEEKPKGFLGLPWEKVRELLRAWLDSGQVPLSCDTELISAYMREMVIKKDIEKVNILINFLRRRTSEIGSSEWSEVYNHVIQEVQKVMIFVYGKKMFIGD